MKAKFVALAVAATLGLGSVSAFAQDHHHDGRGQAAWQHQRGDWGNQRYAAPRYDSRGYGYRHDDGDIAGALVVGALTGALLGQATNSYNYYTPPATYYAPPATYYTPPATYYSPPATYYPGYGYYGN